ncbi:MAG: glycosyltransferase [Elainellaceae cyanobacterium]
MASFSNIYPLLISPSGALKIPAFPFNVSTDHNDVNVGNLNADNFNDTRNNVYAHSAPHSLYFSLIIPTFNESKNVAYIVAQLSELLDQVIPSNYELIIVDDDSPDQTWNVAQSLTQQYPQLRVMRRQYERGLASAVIRGWQVAKGEVLGVIDADLQHPPTVLLDLLSALEKDADLAVASRHVEGGGVSEWSIVRRFLSRGAQVLGLAILPHVIGRVSDPMSGYFIVRRNAISGVDFNPMGYKILIEVLGRGNIDDVAEVGYVFQERKEGESKVTWKQYIDYILHLARLRSRGRIGNIRRRLYFPAIRFVQFGLVGLSGVFVDMSIFYLLTDPSSFGWALTRSKVIASECAIINNFLWNDAWTFRDISRYQTGFNQRIKRFLKFNAIALGGLVLNVLILNLLFNVFNVNPYIANAIAISIVSSWNFWLNVKLGWRVTDAKQSTNVKS